MNTDIEIDDSVLIAYAFGYLQPEQAAFVKSQLEKDPDIMLQYQGIKGIIKMYPDRDPEEVLDEKTAEIQAFTKNLIAKKKTKLQNLEDVEKQEFQNLELRKKENSKKLVWLKNYAAAAIIITVIAFLCIITYELLQPQKQSPGNLASLSPTQIIEPLSVVNWTEDNIRGETDDETALWQDAATHFNFQQAINLLQKKQNRTPVEQYYFGMLYFKLKQYSKAETELMKAAIAGNPHKREATFFLASAQYFQHKKEAAKQTLETIKGDTNADELFKSINNEK